MNRIEDVYGLTPVQEGIYAQYFRDKTTEYYHLYYLFVLNDNTDLDVLQQALNLVALRHPVLRTAFAVVEGTIKQVILADRFPTIETRFFNQPYASDVLDAAVKEEMTRRFDPKTDSLFCCKFLLFSDKRFLFIHTHHLIIDGWCTSLLFEDLITYYCTLVSGEEIESLKTHIVEERSRQTSFGSYVNLIRQRDPDKAQRYWRTLLENWLPVTLPKKKGKTASVSRICQISPRVPPKIRQRAESFARAQALPLNAVLESAFALAMQKCIGSQDVVFHKAISGRSFGLSGIEHTLGPMINTVPVRVRWENGETPREFLLRINEQAIDANEYGFLPLSDVCRENGIDPKSVDVLFDFGNYMAPSVSNTKPISLLETKEQTEFPLTCILSPENESFRLTAIFDSTYFSPSLIQSFLDSFLFILVQLISLQETQLDDRTVLSQLLQLTSTELEMLFGMLDGFGIGKHVSFPSKSVYEVFTEQAASLPDVPRITDGKKSYTFADLRTAAEKTDAYIRSHLGEEKQVIGVLCDRSFWELAAIFGVIRGGNAYLPISPQYPPARIQSMLETSGCKLVLAQKQFAHLVDCAQCVEELVEQPASAVVPEPAAQPDDTLYVIYTSGSTGMPKGAMVSNRSAVNRIQWMKNRFFDETTVVMRKTPYTFDVSVWEIFGFAMYGFSLYILPPDEHYNQQAVLSHIEKGRVTDLHFVPTVFEQFLTALRQTPNAKQMMRSVRHIILSGETLLAKDVNAFHRYHDGQIRIHNLYGPAECAVDVTAYECTATETDPIPIGRPIDNTQIYILDQYQQPVPIGVTGELCIAGDNVGQGYLNRPELTAEKFIDNPFGEGKLYRTGDLAYWREDGNLIFVGRNDFQVKINGQRVELGEIEAALSSQAGIDSAAVIVRKEEAERQMLCAFYTGKPQELQELRRALLKTLPRYMVPQAFAHLDAMPLTASGKIDRRALSARLVSPESASFGYEPPQNLSEKQICQLFSDVLKIEKVGRRDSFYDLGGSSLQLVRLLSMPPLNTLSAADFLAAQTPAALAQMLAKPLEKEYNHLIPLSVPEDYQKAVVLFPYAGGDAGAYTELVGKVGNSRRKMALFYVDWAYSENPAPVIEEIRTLAQKKDVVFYSHCAGSALALELLDCLNAEEHVVKGYIAAASVPSPKARFSFNAWNLVNDSVLVRILTKAGLDTKDMGKPYLHDMLARFRQQTSFYVRYFAKKAKRTNVKTTVIVSSRDPFTKNYQAAEDRWKNTVTEVQRLILIDLPSHYFQNSESELLLSLLSDDC